MSDLTNYLQKVDEFGIGSAIFDSELLQDIMNESERDVAVGHRFAHNQLRAGLRYALLEA